MRRTIIRYVLLSYCLAMRAVSFKVNKRFPELEHLVDAGLMRQNKMKVMQDLEERGVTANKWFHLNKVVPERSYNSLSSFSSSGQKNS